jgi:hypothetical protein
MWRGESEMPGLCGRGVDERRKSAGNSRADLNWILFSPHSVPLPARGMPHNYVKMRPFPTPCKPARRKSSGSAGCTSSLTNSLFINFRHRLAVHWPHQSLRLYEQATMAKAGHADKESMGKLRPRRGHLLDYVAACSIRERNAARYFQIESGLQAMDIVPNSPAWLEVGERRHFSV